MRKLSGTIAILTAVLLGCALLLSACGAKEMYSMEPASLYDDYGSYDRYDYEAMTMPAEAYTMEAALDTPWAAYPLTATADSGGNPAIDYNPAAPNNAAPPAPAAEQKTSTSGRKLVKDLNADVETKQFDKYMAAFEAKTNALGGHIESLNTGDNGYFFSGVSTRSASLTLRVPSD